MVSWSEQVASATKLYKAGSTRKALELFTMSIENGADYSAYESRAAIHEKMKNHKDALLDSRIAIQLAPSRWQNYARAARLFLAVNKVDASLKMVDQALERIGDNDPVKREKLLDLKKQGEQRREDLKKAKAKKAYHLGKLPVETILMIFEYIVEEDPNRVLHLSRICSQWRQIARSTPSLWSRLTLREHKTREKIQLWLDQSDRKIQGIEIGDRWGHIPQDFPWQGINSLQVEAVSALSYRNFCSNNGPPPALESLVFVCRNSGCPGGGNEPSEEAKAYWLPILNPSIKHLKLQLGLIPWDRFPEQLTSLLSLDITGEQFSRSVEPFFDLLQQNACTIEELAFGVKVNAPPRPATAIPSQELPCLKILTLAFPNNPAFTELFLERFSFPSLESFTLNNNPSGPSLLRLIEGGGLATLTTLSLSSSPCNAQLLTLLARHALSLTTIKLVRSGAEANELIELLADPSYTPRRVGSPLPPGREIPPPPVMVSGQLFCPRLTHLDVSHSYEIKTGALMRLVKSRMPRQTDEVESPALAAIHTLVVDGCPTIDAAALPWFRENVASFSCVYMTKKAASWKR